MPCEGKLGATEARELLLLNRYEHSLFLLFSRHIFYILCNMGVEKSGIQLCEESTGVNNAVA